MNADGTNPKQLTSYVGPEQEPAWSPDGTRIAFERYAKDGNAEIYVMKANGKILGNLTKNGANDLDPVWRP